MSEAGEASESANQLADRIGLALGPDTDDEVAEALVELRDRAAERDSLRNQRDQARDEARTYMGEQGAYLKNRAEVAEAHVEALERKLVDVEAVLDAKVAENDWLEGRMKAAGSLVAQVRKSVAEWNTDSTPMADLEQALLAYDAALAARSEQEQG